MKTLLLLGLVATTLMLASCCTSHPPVKVDGNHLTAKVGQKFVIELRGNITTGYVWRKTQDTDLKNVVEFLYDEYKVESSKKDLCGAPGKFFFCYRSKEPGECVLRFEHLRPWEEEAPPIETQEYRITVE